MKRKNRTLQGTPTEHAARTRTVANDAMRSVVAAQKYIAAGSCTGAFSHVIYASERAAVAEQEARWTNDAHAKSQARVVDNASEAVLNLFRRSCQIIKKGR